MLTVIKNAVDRLAAHSGIRRYFFNTAWTAAEQILRIVAGLLVGIWVTRYLGPEKFGNFSYALAFVAIFGGIAKLGLDGIVVRDLILEPSKRDIYLGTAFWLKVFSAIVTLSIITIATIFTSNNQLTNLYILIVASGIIFQSFEVVDFYFQSKVLARLVSLCKISQLFISSLMKIYFVLTEADLFWFVVVSLFDQITLAVAFYIAYRQQRLGGFYRHFELKTACHFLKAGWPVIFSGLVIMIYMRSDQIMIKEMLGEREVGLYSAAVRLSEMWYFIPGAIVSSLFPAIVSARKISMNLYYTRLQRLYTLLAWTAIGIALPVTFLSDWIVVVIYGEAYKEAGRVLMIHVWAGVFVFLGIASSAYLYSENFIRKILCRSLFGAVSNILLNLMLIPRYGISGAAVSTLLAQVAANCMYDIFDKSLYRELKLKTLAILNPASIK